MVACEKWENAFGQGRGCDVVFLRVAVLCVVVCGCARFVSFCVLFCVFACFHVQIFSKPSFFFSFFFVLRSFLFLLLFFYVKNMYSYMYLILVLVYYST